MSDLTVWKFSVPISDTAAVLMPRGARVLSADAGAGWLWVWALVDPAEEEERRTFYVRGTGHSLGVAADATFVGTVRQLGGSLVWHLWVEG